MARFKEKVQIQPGSVSTGAAQGMMSLADRLEGFKSIGANLVKHGAEQARGEAQQRGIASAGQVPIERIEGIPQKPQTKDVNFFGGIEAAAHNKGLQAAYLAELDMSNRESITGFYNENSDSVIKFNEAANAHVRGVLKGIDPAARRIVQQDMEKTISGFRSKVHASAIKKQKKEAMGLTSNNIDDATASALRLSRSGDAQMAANEIEKAKTFMGLGQVAGYWTEAEVATKTQELERDVQEQTFLKNVDQKSDTSIDDAKTFIDQNEDEIPNRFTPDEWETTIKAARADLVYKEKVIRAEDAAISDATEREFFNRLLEGNLSNTDIKNGQFNDERKRTRWFQLNQSQSERARTAKVAERTRIRSEKGDLFTDEQRATVKTQTEAEKELDTLYANYKLTPGMIDKSGAKLSTKRTYRELVKKRNKVAKDQQEELFEELANAEILVKLGEWDDKELESFMEKGLSASEVFQWQQRNTEIKNDPTNYKHNPIYKQGYKDLENAKKNNLFIGGDFNSDLAEDSKNTQLYLKALEQYETMSAEEGADYPEILKTIKQPFIDEAAKGFVRKLYEKINPQQVEEKEALTGMSDEELLRALE